MGRVKTSDEGKRQKKLEAVKKEQERTTRNRRVGFIAGGIILVLVVSLTLFMMTSGTNKVPVKSTAITGVQTFTNLSTKHVNGTIKYQQTPPVGGEHSAMWLNCGIYANPVPNENAVHSLEHSAVWITYDPTLITGDQLVALRKLMPKTYVILSPYPNLPAPIVASAWGFQLRLTEVTDPRITGFLAKYREAKSAPEPSSPCTDGVDGPGKIS